MCSSVQIAVPAWLLAVAIVSAGLLIFLRYKLRMAVKQAPRIF